MNVFSWFKTWRLNSDIKRADILDEKLTQGLETYGVDFARLEEDRKLNRSELLKTRNAIERVEENKTKFYRKDLKNLINLEGKELTAYQRDLQKQISDLHKILDGVDKITKNEVAEILYDIRNPLLTYSIFVDKIKDVLKNKKNKLSWSISKESEKAILASLEEIRNIYHKLVKDTLALIQIHISKTHNSSDANSADFSQILKQRAKAKSSLNAQRRALLKSIDKLEKLLIAAHFKKDDSGAQFELIRIISEFKNQFNKLFELCENRIKLADDMIIRVFKLEIKYVAELKRLKEEVDALLVNLKESKTKQKTKEFIEASDETLMFKFEKFDRLFGVETVETMSRFEKEMLLSNSELKKLEEKVAREEVVITEKADEDLKIIKAGLESPTKSFLKRIFILGLAANLFVQTTMVAPEMGGGPLRETKKVQVIDDPRVEKELEMKMLTNAGTSIEAQEIINFETTFNVEVDVPASFAPTFNPKESQIFKDDYSKAIDGFNEDLASNKAELSEGLKETAKDTIKSIESKYHMTIPQEVKTAFNNMSPDFILADAKVTVVGVDIIGLACIKGSSQTIQPSGLTGMEMNANLAAGRAEQFEDTVLSKTNEVFAKQGIHIEIPDSVINIVGEIARDTKNAEMAVNIVNDWLKTNPSNVKILDSKGKEIKSIDFRKIKTDHKDTHKKELDNFDRVMNKMRQIDVKTFENIIYDVLKNDRGIIVKIAVKVEKPIKVAIVHEKYKDPYLLPNNASVPQAPVVVSKRSFWRDPRKVQNKPIKGKPRPNLPRYEASRRKLIVGNGGSFRQKTFAASKGGRR